MGNRIIWSDALWRDIDARMRAGQPYFDAACEATDAAILAHRQKSARDRDAGVCIDSYVQSDPMVKAYARGR